MKAKSTYISYQETGRFSSLICDYLNKDASLLPFFNQQPTIAGFANAISERNFFPTDRKLIHRVFVDAYSNVETSGLQKSNIDLLLSENTFTVCTAHQPNIFSGYLYFIYKTAHAIVLAKTLSKEFPTSKFVPVFYIGSEDNDFDELSRFQLHGKLFRWNTDQQGAVGRMKVDKGITELISQIEAELGHLPFAIDLVVKIKKAYIIGNDIAEATFILLNELFRNEGLLVLQPDMFSLKESMKDIFRDDLLHSKAFSIVTNTDLKLSIKYHLQVNPRPINLFYLLDNIRNRIDKRDNIYSVDGTAIRFTEKEILEELETHPERFSPNVILRGIYQETILPNIAFIGGGSEVAYWMQLKDLFNHYKVPYPVLVLRNSFIIVNSKQEHKLNELGIRIGDLFKDETVLANEMVIKWKGKSLSLAAEVAKSKELFASLKKEAGSVDKSLFQHVHSLEVDLLKKIEALEKKMLRAERRIQAVQLQRIWKIKAELFPKNNLQERVDNFMPYYAEHGEALITSILDQSLSLEHQFILMIID